MTHFHPNFCIKCSFSFFFILYTCLIYFIIGNFFLKDGFTKLIGVRQNMISDEGGRGVSQFLILSEKGGRGVSIFLNLG